MIRALLLSLVVLTRLVLEPVSGAGQNPLRGKRLYVDPNTPAGKQAAQWARSRPQDAALLRRVAAPPHGNWQQPAEIERRLRRAGIEVAQGFSLNVSNFHSTQVNISYGERLSRMVGGKHFLIDTSRNGRGATVVRERCNARNQALGTPPTTNTGHPLVDAFLWVKTPGQSDGPCNGGPRAGEWWAEYALELTRAAEAVLPR